MSSNSYLLVLFGLGGWRRICDETELKGGINIAFECGSGSGCYLAAMDNGRFTVGGPHAPGEEPNPEEVRLSKFF